MQQRMQGPIRRRKKVIGSSGTPSEGGHYSQRSESTKSGILPSLWEISWRDSMPGDTSRKTRRNQPIFESTPTGSQSLDPRIPIYKLRRKKLLYPLYATLQPDGDGFVAQIRWLRLYGSGQTTEEAIQALKREVESLYADLMEDDDFTPGWLRIKARLNAYFQNGQ